MTATTPTRPIAAAGGSGTPRSAVRRTLLTLLAAMLGVVPLKALLSDNVWLIEAWLTMAVVIAPAAVLRARRGPGALDIWPGIVLLVPLLTAMFVSQHAFAGIIPTGGTISDIGNLMDSLHRTTRDEVAPIHSTPAVRLVICALVGLLAALTDLIAVVGRRGALAGVPLLVVFTVSGAVPRTPVAWGWFVVAAVGYLLLLGLDADDELRGWGRRISRGDVGRVRTGAGLTAQRIGITAVAVAVVLPLIVPSHSKNLLADAFRSSGGSGLGGLGPGNGTGGISPFANLKGQLNRDKPTRLFTVHVQSDSATPVQPFYDRSNVLDRFTGDGWVETGHGTSESVEGTAFGTTPATRPRTVDYRADVTISGLTGNAPVFAVPRGLQGVSSESAWSGRDQLLLNSKVHQGQAITEFVAQPQPTVADLRTSGSHLGADMSRWLDLPTIPTYVTDLVTKLIAGKPTPYDKARAISNYFADPSNGFVYSLKTKEGDSGSELVDFLKNRVGFCQQYAAAMGVMLRLAGVPSRVVLGYMHASPDRQGNFTVTTFDAHAWVEAYFPGSGWIPFDPTPPAGLSFSKKGDLNWAPHVFPSAGNDVPHASATTTAPRAQTSTAPPTSSAAPVASSGGGGSDSDLMWLGLGVLVIALLAATPALLRAGRRRRRYAAARRGDADALWAELSDTAIDLGYVWSPARTPRQVSDWLSKDAAETAPALTALATAVERRRYARDTAPDDSASLTQGLQQVTDALRARRTGRTRLQARLWPASLGWSGRMRTALSRLRRRRH